MRPLPLLVPLAVLLFGCPKGKGKLSDPDGGPPALDVSRSVQVAVVTPGSIPVQQATSLRVTGAGFTEGATVSIDGDSADQTDRMDENTLTARIPGLPAGTYDVTVTNPDGASATLRGGLRVVDGALARYAPGCERVTVYFGLDQAGLDADARAELQRRLTCWTDSEAPVRVDGHADERGTTDYNLALGQRRADAVAGWIQSAGVSAGRTRAVSYGEERPVDRGHDESAWSKNRRVEISP